MSANDTDDYIRRETDWTAVPLKERAPFLGLCLGAQMLARCLGAAVRPDSEGRVEVGYYPIRPTEAGRENDGVAGPGASFPPRGIRPSGRCRAARRGEVFPNQAFSYGPAAFALQFHIELTTAMVGRWTRRMAERGPQPGAQGVADHLVGRALHDWKTAAFLERFVDQWLATDNRSLALQ